MISKTNGMENLHIVRSMSTPMMESPKLVLRNATNSLVGRAPVFQGAEDASLLATLMACFYVNVRLAMHRHFTCKGSIYTSMLYTSNCVPS